MAQPHPAANSLTNDAAAAAAMAQAQTSAQCAMAQPTHHMMQMAAPQMAAGMQAVVFMHAPAAPPPQQQPPLPLHPQTSVGPRGGIQRGAAAARGGGGNLRLDGLAGLATRTQTAAIELDPTIAAAELASVHGPMRRRAAKGKQGWTREEDAKIVQYVQLTGQKWAVIAALLPGRTDDAVRNRYLRLQKKTKTGDGTSCGGAGGGGTNVLMTSRDLVECESSKKVRVSPSLIISLVLFSPC